MINQTEFSGFSNNLVFKKRRKREANKLVVINEEELIRQVEMRPMLYDKSLKGYRKSALRNQCWKDIAEQLQNSVDECRKRWRSLRDSFSKHYKLMENFDCSKKKKWIFFEQMHFIAPYLDNSTIYISESNISDMQDNSHEASIIEETESSNNNVINEIGNNNYMKDEKECNPETHIVDSELDLPDEGFLARIFETQPEPNCHMNNEHINRKESKKIVQNNKIVSQNSTSNILSPVEYNNSIAFNSEEKFLLSCAPILSRLTKKKNALARVRIQQMLYSIEFEEE